MIIGEYPILDIDLSKVESLSQLKDLILQKYDSRMEQHWASGDHSRVDVDHVFPVTGVGTVILGRVRSGTITRGETLHAFPSKRNCVLRSIQINDVNYNSGENGQRVGLALRGLLPKDVERGFILSTNVSWTITSEIEVRLEIAPYSKLPEEGKMRHLIIGLQAVPARILAYTPAKEKDKDIYLIKLKLEKEIVFFHEEPAFLVDLNGKPKTIGFCTL